MMASFSFMREEYSDNFSDPFFKASRSLVSAYTCKCVSKVEIEEQCIPH
jgi:hypothetical protein